MLTESSALRALLLTAEASLLPWLTRVASLLWLLAGKRRLLTLLSREASLLAGVRALLTLLHSLLARVARLGTRLAGTRLLLLLLLLTRKERCLLALCT